MEDGGGKGPTDGVFLIDGTSHAILGKFTKVPDEKTDILLVSYLDAS